MIGTTLQRAVYKNIYLMYALNPKIKPKGFKSLYLYKSPSISYEPETKLLIPINIPPFPLYSKIYSYSILFKKKLISGYFQKSAFLFYELC